MQHEDFTRWKEYYNIYFYWIVLILITIIIPEAPIMLWWSNYCMIFFKFQWFNSLGLIGIYLSIIIMLSIVPLSSISVYSIIYIMCYYGFFFVNCFFYSYHIMLFLSNPNRAFSIKSIWNYFLKVFLLNPNYGIFYASTIYPFSFILLSRLWSYFSL